MCLLAFQAVFRKILAQRIYPVGKAAQAKNHRGMPLFELNSLPLPHGRQRIIDVSPYGATKGRA